MSAAGSVDAHSQNGTLPPHSTAAEAGVLGCIFLSPNECIDECANKLYPESFFEERHRRTFSLLREMRAAKQPIDLITVQQKLRDRAQLDDAGGLAYLASLPDLVPSAANLSYYIEIVREKSAQRSVIQTTKDIADHIIAYPEHASTIIKKGRAALDQLSREHLSQSIGLTVRKPSELLAMRFDDTDKILGDRLLAKGQSLTILGAGGLGKSRIVLQLAAAINTGRDFLGLATGNGPLRWLILQTENSNRRLQFDISAIRKWLGDDFSKFEDHVCIHTIENDSDTLVSLDAPAHVEAIRHLIATTKPDVIAFDPLNAFAIGDQSKDQDMRATCMELSRLCREGNPERSIVVLHHAITGKSGAAKAVGFDRSSFGRNSKVLHSWTRGQINIAPARADDNSALLFSCGKCSNGREFERFAAKMDDSMIYEVDPHFDFEAWESDVMGQKSVVASMNVAQACELLAETPLSKAAWVKAIMGEAGCAKSKAYNLIAQGDKRKLVFYSKVLKTYALKKA